MSRWSNFGGSLHSRGERFGSRFEVYLGNELLAAHQRAPRSTRMVTLPEHGKVIRQVVGEKPPQTPKRARYQQLLPQP